MKMRTIRRRALAWLLVLVMCLGMLPATALAADQPRSAPEIEPAEIKPKVEYPTFMRKAAEVSYTRPETDSDVYLVCMVDTSIDGNAAEDMSSVLSGCSGLYEASGAQGQTLNYEYTVHLSGGLNGSFAYGAGQANEAAALRSAQEILKTAGGRPVIFWAPSSADSIDKASDLEDIKAELGKVKKMVEAKGGEIIVWQKDSAPSAWLSDYTDHAYAASGAAFRPQVQDSLEKVIADHIEDFTLTLPLVGDLAQRIDAVYTNIGQAEIAGDGRSATVTIPRLYDHQHLEVSLTVKLNEERHTVEEILKPVTGGTYYAGVLDEETALPVFLPVIADRTQRTATFLGGSGAPGKSEAYKAMPGEPILTPDGAEWSTPGNTLGGWKVDGENKYYRPNEALVMGNQDVTLTAQWGHVELDLRLGSANRAEPVRNQMGNFKVYDFFGFPHSVIFENEVVAYTVKGGGTPHCGSEVTLPDKGATKAYYVGVDADNPVIAYRVGDVLHIAGPGGVTAPEDFSEFFWRCSFLEEVNFNNCLDTSGTVNMKGLFKNCSSLQTINFGDTFDTSSVTDMQYMFCGCQALTELDLNNWDTSQVTNMSYMFYMYYSYQDNNKLTKLNIGRWDVSKVQDMQYMFHCCMHLKELDLSGWNTSQVTNMSHMFEMEYAYSSFGGGRHADDHLWRYV